jgi:hypothetical protein
MAQRHFLCVQLDKIKMAHSVEPWTRMYHNSKFQVIVQDKFIDKTVLIVTAAGRIGTWVISGENESKILLGPRDDRIAVLLAKRTYKLMKQHIESKNRVSLDRNRALLLGVGLPQLRQLEQDEQLELLKEIEDFLVKNVFSRKSKEEEQLAAKFNDLDL